MKKKLLAGVLASATVLGVCMAGGAAQAAVKDTVTTEAGIGFTDYVPGGNEALAIKWAPGNFDFGTTNTVNTSATAYNEDSGSKKYIVIKDERTETNTDKWELNVGLSDIKSGSAQLTGATLEFKATKQAYQGTATPESPGSIVAPTSDHTATVTSTTQVLSQGVTQKVMEDNGNNTSSYKGTTALEMDEIKMNVPAGVAREGRQYSGTVTWSLDDTL
ncbi:WxL domain-containing protein [Enterococcus hulanensis]|uniref:WxL domain-containing protein n=1 Tax=Enterococcus hulanensis TaxID=2559929 RepID=UPI00288DFE3A|nr:WxL domain-containing protein [Enterococcus hulanensis]MDT2659194.1 WxL domain-containing protein [Enterococcus hulanensis]